MVVAAYFITVCRYRYDCTIILMLSYIFAARTISNFSLVEIVENLFRYPWHASCKIDWQFPGSCSAVRAQIVGQMNAWQVSEVSLRPLLCQSHHPGQGDALCPGTSPSCPELPCGQNCLYDLVTSSDTRITGTHTTPVAR